MIKDIDFYKLNIFDAILIILILGGSAGVILFTGICLNRNPAKTSEAAVYQEGKLIQKIRLNENRQITLLNGKMTIETADRKIRVLRSDCPRNVCVRSGWIKTPGEMIACIPNKILIEIRAGDSPALDAVVY